MASRDKIDVFTVKILKWDLKHLTQKQLDYLHALRKKANSKSVRKQKKEKGANHENNYKDREATGH